MMVHDMEAFKRECAKFAAVRRRKWQRKSEGYISHHWECIGDGYYSEVWRHEHYRGLVCKISGTAGWGYEDTSAPTRSGVPDAWVGYAKFCMQAQGRFKKYLPEVHHLERISAGIHWAIIKEYSPARCLDWDRLQECRSMFHHAKWAIDMRAEVEDSLGGIGTRIDLHGNNFMYDEVNDQVIVTDPLSTTEHFTT